MIFAKKRKKKKKKMQKPIKPLQKHLNAPLNQNSQIKTHCHNWNHRDHQNQPPHPNQYQPIITHKKEKLTTTIQQNHHHKQPTTYHIHFSKPIPQKQTESSNSVKHYSLFRPQILKPWLNYFYSNLFKCGTRLNDTQ